MEVKKLSETEKLSIVGNMYGLLWYLKDAIDQEMLEKQQSDKLVNNIRDRYLSDRIYQRIKVQEFCKIVQIFGRLG